MAERRIPMAWLFSGIRVELSLIPKTFKAAATEAPQPVYATLTCGHQLLWDDPDEDVTGSFLCGACGLYVGVASFGESAGTNP